MATPGTSFGPVTNFSKISHTMPSIELIEYNNKTTKINKILGEIVIHENANPHLVSQIQKSAHGFFAIAPNYETYNKNKTAADDYYNNIGKFYQELDTIISNAGGGFRKNRKTKRKKQKRSQGKKRKSARSKK